ncbi:MAG: multicopper oxidase domain-containing protein [Ignavibacteriaceae bacterium]
MPSLSNPKSSEFPFLPAAIKYNKKRSWRQYDTNNFRIRKLTGGNNLILYEVFFGKKNFWKSTFLFFIALNVNVFAQHTVRYDLYVNDTTVNFSGEPAKAIAVNGQIPGPTLNFTEGDTAEIYVHNLMNKETSVHWHGIILPNEQDGVPYLTSAPILPHTTHLYKFPIVQHGTYWYHSHTGFQEQRGLYGALILHRKQRDTIPEFPVVLSDWTDESPEEVIRTLKMANDWYSIEKGSAQSYGEALVQGYIGAKIEQEWLRMFPMDVSDVYYNAFLTNGKIKQALPNLKAGDKIKLRIINGSSSTYFWLQFAGGKLAVVANDGDDVVPVKVDRMIIGVAETYDVIVTIPDNMSYEFRATSEDRTNHTSLWLGSGMKMPAPTLPTLEYFKGMKMMNSMMNFDGTMNNMGMQMTDQEMDMNTVMYPEITGSKKNKQQNMPDMGNMQMNMNGSSGGKIITLNYSMLKAPEKTTLPNWQTKVLHFTLTGNMNRYQWSINNKTLSQSDKILIHKGENVRIILDNQTMMRHPMHLHGHTFRLLNGQGDYDPLKNVLDIMPMEVDTIEFAAQYYGDWFFHCHILYHMMSGMGRVFSYTNSPPNPQIDTIKNTWQKFLSDENMWHFSTFIAAQSNGILPKVVAMNRNYVFDVTGGTDYKGNFETEARFGRLFGNRQFLEVYIGGDIRRLSEFHNLSPGSKEYKIENRTLATVGVDYLLPMFIQTDLRLDHTGRVRFQISRSDLALTARLRLEAMWNTDKEYDIGARYILTKRFSLSANYDSHFGAGGGITYTY